MTTSQFTTRSDAAQPELHGVQLREVMAELQRVIVGQDRVLERVLVALMAGGHCLLEGVPGLGKTLTVSTLAKTLGGTFTPDPVHTRPVAFGHRRHPDLPAVDGAVRCGVRPGLRQLRAGR